MGIDLVRPGSGRIPFLVAALSLLSIVLFFNWWSLSSQNLDLLKQIEDLTDHIKNTASLLEQCRHDRQGLETRAKSLEDDGQKLLSNLETKRRSNEDLEKELKKMSRQFSTAQKEHEDTFKRCTTELDSQKKLDISKDEVISSMRVEKSELNTQIQELKQQVADLTTELEKAKSKPEAVKSSTAAVPAKAEKGIVANENNEAKILPPPDHAAEQDEEKIVADDAADPREMEEKAEENNQDLADDNKDPGANVQ